MSDIFPPLNPLKWACNIIGVWPVSCSFDPKSVDIYLRVLILSVNLYSAFLYYNFIFQNQTATTNIIFVSLCINASLFSLLNLITLILGFTNKSKMANILREFIQVDQELLEIGSQPDIKGAYMYQRIIITTAVVLNLPNLSMSLFVYGLSKKYCVFLISMIQNVLHPVMIAGIAHAVKSRYHCINSEVSSMLQDAPTTPSSVILLKLRKLLKIHSKLRGIVQAINSTFSLQLILFLLYTISRSSFTTLVFLRNIKAGKSIGIFDMNYIYTAFKYLSLVILLTEQCHAAALEGNKTVLLVHDLHQRNTHIRILEEIEHFSLGMIKNYTKFSAGGILDIGRSLLPQICVIITTYFVISLQIEDV